MSVGEVRRSPTSSNTAARLAVIEEKLEVVLSELSAIREYIPGKMVEHSERISVLERNMRTFQWLGCVLGVTLIGAFIGHILAK